MAVHAKVMAQGVAHDPFHHALGQASIDHAAKRLRQRGIAHDPLYPRPKVQDSFRAGVGGEIL
jgi:hypothetical protein